jgi:glycosyltransferase involved in cell wall biosynthesis
MVLVVDGIAFQLGQGAIVRLWHALLRDLQYREDLKIIALDRGNFPIFDKISIVPFPSYTHTMTAGDSILIQKICDLYEADMFVSTYYTSPLTTPSVMIVSDMSAEIFRLDSNRRIWKEKTVAITSAQRYVCLSSSTRDDLLNFHPSIDVSKAGFSYYSPDVDNFYYERNQYFQPSSNNEKLKDYILIPELISGQGYLDFYEAVFEAVMHLKDFDLDVICCNAHSQHMVGLEKLSRFGVEIKFATCSAKELGAYYRDAFAMLCHAPSEDGAISIIEAMTCGCPILSSKSQYISEICEEAAYYLSDLSQETIETAIHQLADEEKRSAMKSAGSIQVRKIRSANLSDALASALNSALMESKSESSVDFRNIFSSLRMIQNDVDTDVFVR